MERVTGVGGLFFRARDPDALARWYADHLGVDPAPTSYDERPWWQQQGPTVLSPFPADTDAFGRPEQAWMLNLRVRDLDAMVVQLRAAGIEVSPDPQTYPNGRLPPPPIPKATRSSCGSPPKPRSRSLPTTTADDQGASTQDRRPARARPVACPPVSTVGDLAEVGAEGGQRGCSVGLYGLDVGGLGGLPFGVLEHQPDVAGAGPAPVVADGAAANVFEQLDQAAGYGRLLGPRPTDLGRAEPQVVGELRQGDGHTQRPLRVVVWSRSPSRRPASMHNSTDRWWTAWIPV
jgi:glyoxylase I family protein